ncbi:MAG: N-acetylglucosamine-6-phosphate deacetylase [Phyllobacteriaceae bacterium]|nr:N-acetylglucosamine-6-phosphate deacetylase [Phyllobacteriaceae bacterium]
MSGLTVFRARVIFDGSVVHRDRQLVVEDGRVRGLVPLADTPPRSRIIDTEAEWLSPGFVDWQVNGGGGVLFNDNPGVEGLARIADAHRRFGTTALLPTVITDAPAVTKAAAEAAAESIKQGTPGIAGIHFEGPHISVARKGVHDARFIRPMEQDDLALLRRRDIGRIVATVAPENATVDDVAALAEAGTIVSLGHTAADHDTARRYFAAGAQAVTHLFNAMEPLHHRAPGLIGAALENPSIYCGLIADGHHVHPSVLSMVFAAGPKARLTLVTDAMSSVGDPSDTFELNGRTVHREDGRLTIDDGTLAGSDLDMVSAIGFAVRACGVSIVDALRMATSVPAGMLGLNTIGSLRPGARADIVTLTEGLEITGVHMAGEPASLG